MEAAVAVNQVREGEGGWGKCGWSREGEGSVGGGGRVGVWVEEGWWGSVGGGEEEGVGVHHTKLTFCILSLKVTLSIQ